MRTVTLEVPDDLADQLERASTQERARLVEVLSLLAKSRSSGSRERFRDASLAFGEKVERAGLTEAIAAQLLAED